MKIKVTSSMIGLNGASLIEGAVIECSKDQGVDLASSGRCDIVADDVAATHGLDGLPLPVKIEAAAEESPAENAEAKPEGETAASKKRR